MFNTAFPVYCITDILPKKFNVGYGCDLFLCRNCRYTQTQPTYINNRRLVRFHFSDKCSLPCISICT